MHSKSPRRTTDMNFQRDIVVVGASAGGVNALKQLVSELPVGFPASIFIVQHTSPTSPGLMADILESLCALPVTFPRDGEAIQSSHVYVAPPDYHLVLEEGRIRVTRGPRENRFRPSIDVLFRSAAWTYGPRVIGVVLTGYLDDGASGLYAIKERGGLAVVQTPEDAEVPDMPLNALRRVRADEIVPLSQIARSLTYFVAESLTDSGGNAVSENETKKDELKRMEIEVAIAREVQSVDKGILALGEPSLFACPECHGVLLKIKEGAGTRFRCHTGHAYSLDALLIEISQSVEESLWNSLRAIEETELLLDHMAAHLSQSNDAAALKLIEEQMQQSKRQQQLVRQALMKHRNISGDEIEAEASQ